MHPLVVDLDGTLVNTDMLHESALRVFRDNPLDLILIPFWLSSGKAAFKKQLSSRFKFDPELLPYNDELIDWLKQQKSVGRKLILCTASDKLIAECIAENLNIFDEVISSNGTINIAGQEKAAILVKRYGNKGFDYVGNSTTDIKVWEFANKSIIVNASNSLIRKAKTLFDVDRIFPAKPITISTCIRLFRIHQWMKNFLLFVPILAAHQFLNGYSWVLLILAFFSFGFCASSVYIINDLLDLESDRQHPRKKNRPLASGRIPSWFGMILAPVLLFISVSLARYVGENFFGWLIFYFLLTSAYSWGLKRIIIVDCLALALLYTLRIIAGAATINQDLSFWLLAFSVFIFLSLAFVKRYAELEVKLLSGSEKVHGRGYLTSDATLIQSMGITSGYASALLLALYLNSDNVLLLYKTPEFVWGTVPVLIFWVSWMWMQAHRGKMYDDPLVFAVKDKPSVLAGVLFGIFLIFGAIGFQW